MSGRHVGRASAGQACPGFQPPPRAAQAARELGIEYTEQVKQADRDAWAKIRAHQAGGAAA